MLTFVLFAFLTAILISLYLFSTKKYDYWRKKNVPHLKPTPVLGNYGDYILLKRSYGEVAQEICRKFPKAPYIGTYFGTEPALLIQDPDLIKVIVAKDFVYFHGREVCNHTHKEVLTKNMFFSYGDRWKILRQSMSPIFTSAKLKNMFHLIQKCAITFEEMLERETKRSHVLDVRQITMRYTMDCISSCGFGIDVNTMMKENIETNPFFKIGTLIFLSSKIRGFFLIARSIWPTIFYSLGLNAFPREIYKFFQKVLVDVFESRGYKPSGRNDLVDISLSLKEKGSVSCESLMKAGKTVSLEVNEEFLLLQSIVFFAAGFETSATTLSYALYELAKDKECQKRALAEVDEYLSKHGGKVDFDCTTDLPFLYAVIEETLRLYPVLGVITREVMTNYTLPDGLRLDKSVRIHIPLFHLHHNPEFFPEPERFKPDRFMTENRQNIKPYSYMPFGEGPRLCIGMRVAKMQMLPGLVTILKNYMVELAEGTPTKIQFDPCTFIMTPTHGLMLKFIRRETTKTH